MSANGSARGRTNSVDDQLASVFNSQSTNKKKTQLLSPDSAKEDQLQLRNEQSSSKNNSNRKKGGIFQARRTSQQSQVSRDDNMQRISNGKALDKMQKESSFSKKSKNSKQ